MTRTRRHVLVVGNGMAGARLAEEIRHRDPDAERFAVTVVGEEPHAAYNRVLLSTVVAGGISPRDTRLKPDGWWSARHVDVVTGARVTAIDAGARTATLDTDGVESVVTWDEPRPRHGQHEPSCPRRTGCLPAPRVPVQRWPPGSSPSAPSTTAVASSRLPSPLPPQSCSAVACSGSKRPAACSPEAWTSPSCTRRTSRWTGRLDADGGAVLSRVVRGIGARLVLGRLVVERHAPAEGASAHVVLDDGTTLAADLVVVATGVRPRTDLAVATGLDVDRGIVVDDRLATSLPHVHAIGECAQHRGEVPGLVQPGWDQARVLADVLTGADPDATYEGTSVLTRLKAPDIDLASMGTVDVDVHDPGHEVLAFTDPSRGRYAKARAAPGPPRRCHPARRRRRGGRADPGSTTPARSSHGTACRSCSVAPSPGRGPPRASTSPRCPVRPSSAGATP